MITVYYFDGSGGCDRCKDATGYSFKFPTRPHPPYCDCPIIEEDVVLDDFDIQYRNLVVLEDSVEVLHGHTWTDCFEADRTIQIEFDEEEEKDIDPDLEESAEGDWSPPETEEEDVEVEVPAGNFLSITVRYERYTVDLLADVYAVGRIGGETFETELEPERGHYEKNVRILDAEEELEPCVDD